MNKEKISASKNICPYYGGAGQIGKEPTIKCSHHILSCFQGNTENRDKMVADICKGEMDKCWCFLSWQLEEMGAISSNEFKNYEELQKLYLEVKEIEKQNNVEPELTKGLQETNMFKLLKKICT